MSTFTNVESKSILYEIASGATGSTFYTLTCKQAFDWSVEKTTVSIESDCGTHVGTGASKITSNFTFVYNATPEAGEISAAQVLAWADAGQKVWIKTTDGDTYYRLVGGYINSYKESADQGGFLLGTGVFTGEGTFQTSE